MHEMENKANIDRSIDDDGNELIGYVVEKHDASFRNVWQRIGYNGSCTFAYTNTGFPEDAAHHFHVYIENCVGMISTLTTIDPIIAKISYIDPHTPKG
ncbi:unnamed protein product [Rotaria sordida]|uniref:Uncharacterized protein n=1 Tax=Rotaria sordida TaxID=392033 RepID=A0A814DSD8_9BILA|nr:unnamed protein product [Rotaria sordida]CAF1041129.1 unnamed protein product [Rotaria sordida]